MLTVPPIAWIGFMVFFAAMLALDLGLFHRRSHVVTTREALAWTATWVALALAFGAGVWSFAGHERGVEFLTGYLLELSLSADNVFVIALLFSYFAVPPAYQHKVLLWGVIGAVVMRFAMILAGTALVARAEWVLYAFGGLLIVAGVKLVANKAEAVDPARNPLVRLVRRLVPVTADFRGDRLFVREGARWAVTPLFVALLSVETADLVFAIDSIPAIFSVTLDPFLVFTSNVFAILGLRSLYFLLAGAVHRFRFLKPALGVVLAFAGVKMLLAHTAWKVDNLVALGVVAGTLAVGVVASLATRRAPVAPAALRAESAGD